MSSVLVTICFNIIVQKVNSSKHFRRFAKLLTIHQNNNVRPLASNFTGVFARHKLSTNGKQPKVSPTTAPLKFFFSLL